MMEYYTCKWNQPTPCIMCFIYHEDSLKKIEKKFTQKHKMAVTLSVIWKFSMKNISRIKSRFSSCSLMDILTEKALFKLNGK